MKQTRCVTTVAFISFFMLGGELVLAESWGKQAFTQSDTIEQNDKAPSTEEFSNTITDVLRRAEDALEALDADALVSLYAEDFLFEDTSAGIQIKDKAELRAYFNRLFQWPNCAFYDTNYFGLGKRAAGQWTWGGSSNPSGEKFSIRGASLFKIEGDSIIEEIIFYDPRPAYR